MWIAEFTTVMPAKASTSSIVKHGHPYDGPKKMHYPELKIEAGCIYLYLKEKKRHRYLKNFDP